MAKKGKNARSRKSDPTAPKHVQPRRRTPARLLFVGGVLIALGVGAWSVLSRPRRDFSAVLTSGSAAGFNVVTITLDTTRADHLGCYGNRDAATPNMDRLAAEGIRFTDAVAPVPITLPSHSSMFTGLDPYHHGVRHNGEFRLDAAHVTLAEVLKEKGYATAAFVSTFVLDPRFGLNQGFDVYNAEVDTTTEDLFGGMENERSGEGTTNAALAWLRSRPTDRPFFLWVHYYDAHFPYNPPAPFAARFPQAAYDGEIASVDGQVGRLVRALREAELEQRTLLVILGDHGEGLGEHSEETHSRLVYEATQHVPLMIWCPALVRRSYVVDDAVVGVVDLFPSILDMLGIQRDGVLDGESWLKAREHPERMIYMETMATYFIHGWSPLYGLRRLNDKYIFAPKPEYYDLQRDGKEVDNLYESRSQRVKESISAMGTALAERMKESPSAEAIAAATVALDPESRGRLESLGYLSGEAPPPLSDDLPDPKVMMPTLDVLKEIKHLSKIGRHEEALARAGAAHQRSPKDWGILKQIGIIYLTMNQPDKAIEPFRKCLEIRPNPNVYLLLGQIMIQKGRFDEAVALLDQSEALEPGTGAVTIARGDMQAAMGRPHDAIAFYERAMREDPFRAKKIAEGRIANVQALLSQGR